MLSYGGDLLLDREHAENSGGLGEGMLPEHTRSVKLFCSIDVSALAAVMLVLVVIMMIVESATHHGFGPDLPHVSRAVSMPGANREDAMVIVVMRDGSIYFGADKVGVYQLRSKILERLKDRSVERKAYIRADGRVWYSTVKEVLDGVRTAGIERVAFLVNQRRPPTAGLYLACPR
jgi:biopolymer transport protein ExbD